MKLDVNCQRFTLVSPCPNKAIVEVDGEFLCKECASIEKGRLEAVSEALRRASAKAKARLKALKNVKSSPYQGEYRVVVKVDVDQDVI